MTIQPIPLRSDDFFGRVYQTVEIGITASVIHTQGSGQLKESINEIAVCDNDLDTVTLPPVIQGTFVAIINRGTKTLQIFPTLSDNIDARGFDIPTTLRAESSAIFVPYSATDWEQIGLSGRPHAQMFDTDNADPFGINAVNSDHMYHSNGIQAGELLDWTFDPGGAGTPIAIASIADGGGGEISVTTSVAHGLVVDGIISITNTGVVAYDDTFKVNSITSPTVFKVTAVFSITATGVVDQAATLKCGVGSAGRYVITWSASVSPGSNNDSFDFAIHRNEAHQGRTNTRSKFGNSGDHRAIAGAAILTLVAGDKLSWMARNVSGAGDLTVRNFSMVVHSISEN